MAEVKNRSLSTEHLEVYNVGTIDATAADADASLLYGERFYGTLVALDNGVGIEIPNHINGAECRFKLSNNNDDAVVDVWACKKGDDNLRLVCSITLKAGNQTSSDGYKYADTGTVSKDDGWPKTPKWKVTDEDYMGVLVFDACGCNRIAFHGHTTFDSDCIVEISGY